MMMIVIITLNMMIYATGAVKSVDFIPPPVSTPRLARGFEMYRNLLALINGLPACLPCCCSYFKCV